MLIRYDARMITEENFGDNDVEKRSKIQSQTKVITLTGRIKNRESNGNFNRYENVNPEASRSTDELDVKLSRMKTWRVGILKDLNDKVFSYTLDDLNQTKEGDDSLSDISEFVLNTRRKSQVIDDTRTKYDSENIFELTLKEELINLKLLSLEEARKKLKEENARALLNHKQCVNSRFNNDTALVFKKRTEADFKPRFSKVYI